MTTKKFPVKHLYVKRSTLPSSGKGLFTKEPIKKGTKIVEYTGKITKWNDAAHRDGKNPYLFYVNKNHVIDPGSDKKALAKYANDAKGPGQLTHAKNNSTYLVEGKRVYIKGMKDIPAGSEILVGYGKEYWDIMKSRLKKKK